MFLATMTMPQVEAALEQTRTVIIPWGSVEEHGSHLPLNTDLLHAEEVARRAAVQRPVLVAPPLPYGVCRSTSDHPGTVSISAAAVRLLARAVSASLYRMGCRQMLFLTGHAGSAHLAALIEAGEQLLSEFPDIKVAVVNVLDLLQEARRREPTLVQTSGDAHAGEVETAIVLALRPDLVQGRAPAEWPAFPKFILTRQKRRYWPGGVWGDPAPATAAQGTQILEAEVKELLRVLQQLENYPDSSGSE
ncbi:MAG: creatininase family protein [Desulfobacca sp.]|uniref:creatininase family protein n=1 Tax=Desulfobacca sp. TaxID=2067990 RepID=UPI00404AEDED